MHNYELTELAKNLPVQSIEVKTPQFTEVAVNLAPDNSLNMKQQNATTNVQSKLPQAEIIEETNHTSNEQLDGATRSDSMKKLEITKL